MACRLTILGSGSGGNCALLESDTTRVLVDAGFSCKQIEERLMSVGETADRIHGVLMTHEHSDHMQGVRVMASRYQMPVYANRMTRAAMLETMAAAGQGPSSGVSWKVFESGQRFAVGDFDVEPFTIPHDASDPVGFLLHHAGICVAFLTDLGHVTRLVVDKVRQADVLVLEANHDMKMLQNDPHRPWSVKQRISGRHGHLSNESAASALEQVVTDRLKHVYLAHLSQDCNRAPLAEATIRRKLDEMGARNIRLTVASQAVPCPTEFLERSSTVRTESLSPFQASLNLSPTPSP